MKIYCLIEYIFLYKTAISVFLIDLPNYDICLQSANKRTCKSQNIQYNVENNSQNLYILKV